MPMNVKVFCAHDHNCSQADQLVHIITADWSVPTGK